MLCRVCVVEFFCIRWLSGSLFGSGDIHDTVIPKIIIAVDIYLIAIVLLIFGSGIYRLFISPIDQSEDRTPSHPFNVGSFDQLKDKVA